MTTILLLSLVTTSLMNSITDALYVPNSICSTYNLSARDTSDISQYWANYSPYKPVGEYAAPQPSCTITQANILQRHGARFPTTATGALIEVAIDKLIAAGPFENEAFAFLENFEYTLGTNDLVDYGASELQASGTQDFQRYGSMLGGAAPFVRADSSERVVDSAKNWTTGFSDASGGSSQPTVNVILSSDDKSNTLAVPSPTSILGKIGSIIPPGLKEQTTYLLTVVPKIYARLEANVQSLLINPIDTYYIMQMCPFDTTSRTGSSTPSLVAQGTVDDSPFCGLFTDEEWGMFEYAGDLGMYYGYGYGSSNGASNGAGYVDELITRLTSTPTGSIKEDPTNFPLNKPFYADFTHDDQMTSIFTALKLFSDSKTNPLSLTTPDPNRSFVASKLVPFAGKMVVEKMNCEGKDYVRLFVNDQVQKLEFCGSGDDGVCELNAFVNGLKA